MPDLEEPEVRDDDENEQSADETEGAAAEFPTDEQAGGGKQHNDAGGQQFSSQVLGRVRLERRRAAGKAWHGEPAGARTQLTDKKLKAVKKLLRDGDLKKTEIARQLGISRRSVYRAIELLG